MKVFVHDVTHCNGCHNCQIACKDEHVGNDWGSYAKPQPDTGQFWLKLNSYVRGTVPKVKMAYVPLLCQHCEDAPCIAACSVDAITTRNDGLVIIDPNTCNGCQMCILACPYGAIYYNTGLKIAQKCTGCAHILDRGWPIKEPRCVDSCPTECFKFGEESAMTSLVNDAERLPPDFGDTPDTRVYYKGLPKRFIAGTVYDPVEEDIIENATCTLTGDSGTVTAKTDSFGDFWFEGLEVGTFSLKIEANGKTKNFTAVSTEKDVNLGDIALS